MYIQSCLGRLEYILGMSFYNELATIHGDRFKIYIHNFAKELNEKNPAMDLRKFSVTVVEEAWKWAVDKISCNNNLFLINILC